MSSQLRIVEDLINSYHELNAPQIDILDEEPSPLEFMRYVARNRPFMVRGGARDWIASRKWNRDYLTNVMAGQTVNVAVTPEGNADSILKLEDGTTVFVKPFEMELAFEEALDYIASRRSGDREGPACYCQTQNDNLRQEYESLFRDVPKSIPFARIALDRAPDAINFWLGSEESVTALHRDPYENIYCQILGQKHFVLLPPAEAACINERLHPTATYRPATESKEGGIRELDLRHVLDEPACSIPFASWDPDKPDEDGTEFSHLSRPLRVTLSPGDMLYLPALWYHKVSQSCSDEGICVAVNYWYDMDYSSSFYSFSTFARKAGLRATDSDAFATDEERDEEVRDLETQLGQ